jgi:HEAT repeat protein
MAASKDKDPNVRRMAIQAMGPIDDARVVGSVRAALEDPDQGVRLAAVRVLGKIGDPGSVGFLIAVLGDRREIVRVETGWVLKRLTGEDFGTNRERWKQWWSSKQKHTAAKP